MVNELFVVLAGIMLASFTSMTISLDLQQKYGEIFIYIVVTFLSFNLFFVMKGFCTSIKLLALKTHNYI